MRSSLALAAFAFCTSAQAGLVQQSYDQHDQIHFQEPKYFHESDWSQHYSNRFAKAPLEEEAERSAVIGLVQSYLTTMDELGIQTWLMHGTLLGWWWGKQVIPWKPNAGFQIAEPDLFFLASYYNMTTYQHWPELFPEGREYLLEINPHFARRDQGDKLNAIDARWIDMSTGLFIDITAARYSMNHEQGEGVMYDKNGHEFRDTHIYPLRQTSFEQMPALIPYRYEDLLRSEYGDDALTKTTYTDHIFDKKLERWMKGKEVK